MEYCKGSPTLFFSFPSLQTLENIMAVSYKIIYETVFIYLFFRFLCVVSCITIFNVTTNNVIIKSRSLCFDCEIPDFH